MAGEKCARAGMAALILFLCGCPAGVNPGDNSLLGGAIDSLTSVGDGDTTSGDQSAVDAVVAGANSSQLRGEVRDYGDYRLFDIGAANSGDQLTISVNDPFTTSTPFVVAVFDQNSDLVMRSVVATGQPLTHHIRESAGKLYVGVTPMSSSSGGAFNLRADRREGGGVSSGPAQLVYFNFNGASGLSVHSRPSISFGAFNAADISTRYLGLTQAIKNEVLAVVREDYAPYQVTIMSSDDGPPPAEEHSTVYFGSNDNSLLGLADNVDMYNADPAQAAIIYTDAFAAYEIMDLDAEEMGVMIGNVASHELGHLLGLYHTKNPVDVMDTTGTAWDLAGQQAFERATLEPSVFPYGYENSPQLLDQAVGRREDFVAAARPTVTSSTKVERLMRARAASNVVLRGRCGTCLHLDD